MRTIKSVRGASTCVVQTTHARGNHAGPKTSSCRPPMSLVHALATWWRRCGMGLQCDGKTRTACMVQLSPNRAAQENNGMANKNPASFASPPPILSPRPQRRHPQRLQPQQRHRQRQRRRRRLRHQQHQLQHWRYGWRLGSRPPAQLNAHAHAPRHKGHHLQKHGQCKRDNLDGRTPHHAAHPPCTGR